MTRAERGWLAGILDGEGTISASLREGKAKGGVAFYNTNPRIVKKVQQLVEEIVGELIKLYETGGTYSYKGKDLYRNVLSVRISRKEQLVKLLEKLVPDLVGKRDQAILMLQWARWRMTLPVTNRRRDEEAYAQDRYFVDTLSKLNRANRARSATRNGHTEELGAVTTEEDMV